MVEGVEGRRKNKGDGGMEEEQKSWRKEGMRGRGIKSTNKGEMNRKKV